MAFLVYKHLSKTPIDSFWRTHAEGGIQVDTGSNSSVTLWMRQIDQATSEDPDSVIGSGDVVYFFDPLKLVYRSFRFDGDFVTRTYTEL